jgi:membrane-associated phospholipid phosphatase
MEFRATVRSLTWAALSLTVAAGACWPAVPRQAQTRSSSKEKQGSEQAQQPEKDKEKNKATKQPDQGLNNANPDPGPVSHQGFKGLVGDFLIDQKQIWTSPAKTRLSDAQWLVPLGGITAAFFATDSTFSRHLSHDPSTLSHYNTISNAGVGALIGGAGGMWLLGHVRHNPHWVETGFLAGESAVSSLVVAESLKYSLGRERPFQDNGNGSFFQGGTSFPSEHAIAAWSVASVIAREYPGPLSKIAAYGLATLIDFSRVRARQHFPSDVFVGSALGDLIAQNIYSRRHDPELGGEAWRSISAVVRDLSSSPPSIPASPYVPLDSWVYPTIERLAAEGYIDAAFLGSRPWTRMECARLVQEAGDRIADTEGSSSEPERLYEVLYAEFHHDLDATENGGENSAQLESLYTTSTEIVGRPLDDSYHFGQTIINNYGRPYQQGFNTVDGFSAWAADGRYAIYVRGEYQHAPAALGFSQSIENLIGSLDANPASTAAPISATNQFRLFDTYVSTALGGWNLAFGKQSLWWGQGDGGALLFSDNAEPIYMFRVSRSVPISLPWILHYLGPMKVDAFIGKLSGNEFPPRPVLHGETISFKPTRNLELGFTRMAEMGGAPIQGISSVPTSGDPCPFGFGRALTPAALFNSYFSPHESGSYGCNDNPGKRTAGFEFSYRMPFLRDWLMLYTDSLSPDDVSPISAPRRAAVNPGVYFSHFPKLAKLDLRVEGVNTDTPSSSVAGHYVYYDFFYHDLSTNNGNIIGSWIGREGQGIQAWSTYWFNGRTSLQFGYRHAKVANDFISGGETYNDGSVQLSFWIRRDLNVVASTQYEKWLAPVLAPTAQTNWTSTIGISYQPKGLSLPFRSSRKDQDHGAGLAGKDAEP